MAYPLTITPVSADVRIIRRPAVINIDGSVESQFFMENTIFRPQHSAELHIIRRPKVRTIPASFRWNGLGGIVYIPSFPQLDRQSTSFPHAY